MFGVVTKRPLREDDDIVVAVVVAVVVVIISFRVLVVLRFR